MFFHIVVLVGDSSIQPDGLLGAVIQYFYCFSVMPFLRYSESQFSKVVYLGNWVTPYHDCDAKSLLIALASSTCRSVE